MSEKTLSYALINLTNSRVIAQYVSEEDGLLYVKNPMYIFKHYDENDELSYRFERYNEFSPNSVITIDKFYTVSIETVKNMNLILLYELQIRLFQYMLDDTTEETMKAQIQDITRFLELNDKRVSEYPSDVLTEILEDMDVEDYTKN